MEHADTEDPRYKKTFRLLSTLITIQNKQKDLQFSFTSRLRLITLLNRRITEKKS